MKKFVPYVLNNFIFPTRCGFSPGAAGENRIYKYHIKMFIVSILILSVSVFAGCLKSISPVFSMKNHIHPAGRPFEKRIGLKSDIVLNRLKEIDGRKDYTFYDPSLSEIKEALDAFAKLPPLSKKILNERLTGIYFVNDLLGSGLTEWVDFHGETFCFMAFNPSVLNKGLSELLTLKELTSFIHDSKDISVKINCGASESGFLYILMHEAVHAVDYALRVTPYTDFTFKDFYSIKKSETSFTRGIWRDYSETIKGYPFRTGLTFYGFGGGPKIKISEAADRYRKLSESPFVSLYSSLNWAEDLAEYLTFYHITQVMRLTFSIEVYHKNKIIYNYEPFRKPAILKRSEELTFFYALSPAK